MVLIHHMCNSPYLQDSKAREKDLDVKDFLDAVASPVSALLSRSVIILSLCIFETWARTSTRSVSSRLEHLWDLSIFETWASSRLFRVWRVWKQPHHLEKEGEWSSHLVWLIIFIIKTGSLLVKIRGCTKNFVIFQGDNFLRVRGDPSDARSQVGSKF